MNKLSEQTWIPIGGAAAVIGVMVACTWALQGRLTKIEGAVEVIPKLELKVDVLTEAVGTQDTKIQLMDQKVDNIKANAKIVLKQVNKINQATAVAGALNRDRFGSIN